MSTPLTALLGCDEDMTKEQQSALASEPSAVAHIAHVSPIRTCQESSINNLAHPLQQLQYVNELLTRLRNDTEPVSLLQSPHSLQASQLPVDPGYGPKIGVDDSRINSESHQSENAENVQKPRHLILNRVHSSRKWRGFSHTQMLPSSLSLAARRRYRRGDMSASSSSVSESFI